jgi:hypothetical protein
MPIIQKKIHLKIPIFGITKIKYYTIKLFYKSD